MPPEVCGGDSSPGDVGLHGSAGDGGARPPHTDHGPSLPRRMFIACRYGLGSSPFSSLGVQACPQLSSWGSFPAARVFLSHFPDSSNTRLLETLRVPFMVSVTQPWNNLSAEPGSLWERAVLRSQGLRARRPPHALRRGDTPPSLLCREAPPSHMSIFLVPFPTLRKTPPSASQGSQKAVSGWLTQTTSKDKPWKIRNSGFVWN